MNSDDAANRSPDNAGLTDWEERIAALTSRPAASPSATSDSQATAPDQPGQTEAQEDDDPDDGRLACGLCYRPYFPAELTVASKERFNWESAVVVCPECLNQLRQEMRARSQGPDLLYGFIWAVIGFVITVLPLSAAIWTTRSENNSIFWQWLGCYLAFVPGYVIGRLVRYGVGRRHGLEQQLLAMFFTLAAAVMTAYVGYVADNDVFLSTVLQSRQHNVALPPFDVFLTTRLWPALTDVSRTYDLIPRLLIVAGIALGLVVAYFSSEGSRIYTRPFARPTS